MPQKDIPGLFPGKLRSIRSYAAVQLQPIVVVLAECRVADLFGQDFQPLKQRLPPGILQKQIKRICGIPTEKLIFPDVSFQNPSHQSQQSVCLFPAK